MRFSLPRATDAKQGSRVSNGDDLVVAEPKRALQKDAINLGDYGPPLTAPKCRVKVRAVRR